MRFLAAGWLTLLIGWIVLAVWLWRRERRVVWISSRLFWPATRSSEARNLERSRPPAWVLAALMSLLAIILALSRPILPSKSPRVTVIIDPHVSMSARSGDKSIAREMADRLEEDLKMLPNHPDVQTLLPGSADSQLETRRIDETRWTAASTSFIVEQRCLELARQGETTVVLSAQELNLPPSAVRYAPESMISDRAVVQIGASTEPGPQVMVTIVHPPNDVPFQLILKSHGQIVSDRVVPVAGSRSTTFFVDLPPGASEWLEARIEEEDGFVIDNSAYLAQAGGWPRIEIAGSVPQPAERFAAIYSKARPAGEGVESIVFTSEVQARQRAVVFAPTQPLPEPQTASLDVPWREVARVSHLQVNEIANSLPEGFEVLSRLGERPILAVKRTEPRQVWIGCDVDAFAQRPEWVAWLNALVDFLNTAGPPRWEETNLDLLAATWVPVTVNPYVDASPGVYRAAEGVVVASNLPAVKWAVGPVVSRESLRQAIDRASQAEGFRASGPLCFTALSLGALAGMLMALQSRLDGRNDAT